MLKIAKRGWGRRSTPHDIREIEERFHGRIPPSLMRIWECRQPVSFSYFRVDGHFLTTGEILKQANEGPWPLEGVERGLLPIFDDHQSNLVAVSIRDPLKFRVIHIPHDGESRLLYRDLDGFYQGILDAHNKRECADHFFHEADGDYSDDTPRT